MIDKVQLHKDLLHLLTDIAQTLDQEEDISVLRSIYARVIGEQIDELQGVVEEERMPAAHLDPSQYSLFDLRMYPGQGEQP